MAEEETGKNTLLYEKLAEDIARQVSLGTFHPGQRIPSIRQTSQERKLSITTVLKAYQVLEDQGIIESRPQSGYYVRLQPQEESRLTESPSPTLEPSSVDINSLATRLLHDIQDPALIQFGSGLPSPDMLPTSRLNRIIIALARSADLPQHLYCPPEGSLELRIQIAQHAFTAGCDLSPDEIVITNGCTEAISLSLQAVTRPGDLVAIESPAYFGVLQILQSLDLQILEIPAHPRDGLSLDALRFALERHPIKACIAFSNFNNPLGSCITDERKQELLEILARQEIPLIEDNVAGELYFTPRRPHVAKSYDIRGLVLLCSSFSKIISPSYRVGWVAPGRFYTDVLQRKMASSLSTPILQQRALARFLGSSGYDHHLRRIRRVYAERMAQMSAAIPRYFPKGTRVTNPAGGFVLWVQMPEAVDSLELYQLALKSGVTLAPGYLFSPTCRYPNYIRLSAASWSYRGLSALQIVGDLANSLSHHEIKPD